MTAPTAAELMVQMLEGLSPLREGVAGYRTQLIADGFGPEAADDMAADLHQHLLVIWFAAPAPEGTMSP